MGKRRNSFLQSGLFLVALIAITTPSFSQTTLNATSPSRSYEEIDSVMGLNNGAKEETPDQCTNHPQFGRHILEVWDSTFSKYVFEFYSHVHIDNDRCINFDRQRTEIKTDANSPSYLKGYTGNHLTYSWMFKLPKKFQSGPNFTHIHQIKAVGGDESSPLFTLSPYAKGTKRQMQIVYIQDSTTIMVVVKYASLDSCLGIWVRATENLTVGANGTYSIVLSRVSDGKLLLTYTNNNILTIRPSNTFIRPKWGIYRSLIDSTLLRDDTMRLTNVYLFNNQLPLAPSGLKSMVTSSSSINLSWTETQNNLSVFSIERSLDSTKWDSIASVRVGRIYFSDTGLTPNTTYYYRVKAENPAGSSTYTNISNATTTSILPIKIVYVKVTLTNNQVLINWKVDMEEEVSQYEIEMSKNGTDFNCMATELAKGIVDYNYVFNGLISDKNYFRIVGLMKDGSKFYSTISEAENKKIPLVAIYPNPANEFLNVKITNATSSNSLLIVDALGNLVWRKNSLTTDLLNIGIKQLSSGKYYLLLMDNCHNVSNYPFLITKH